MPTANEVLRDVSLRHAIDVQRFTRQELRAILDLLKRSDAEIVRMLLGGLPSLPVPMDFRNQRYLALLADVRRARDTVMAQIQERLSRDLFRLGGIEAAAEQRLLEYAVPIEHNFAGVSLEQLRAAVTARPFHGRNLGQWYESLAQADRGRLMSAIQLGYAQGESIPNIMRRVRGTAAAGYSDGALAVSRRNAETITRTAINHTSNMAREAVWEANSDVIAGRMWTSTLDGRTTMICASRDGKVAPVGDRPLPPDVEPLLPSSAMPPAHPNCRSVMVAYFDGEGLVGERPYVRTTQRRGAREVDFRRMAREQGRTVSAVRRDWTRANVGQVPARTTYGEWFRRQPAAFQDEVLGRTRGALFRRGGLDIDQFVGRTGDTLTLEQLAARYPEAFDAANVSLG